MGKLRQRLEAKVGLDGAEGPALVLQVGLELVEPAVVVGLEVGEALLLQRLLQGLRSAPAELLADLGQKKVFG